MPLPTRWSGRQASHFSENPECASAPQVAYNPADRPIPGVPENPQHPLPDLPFSHVDSGEFCTVMHSPAGKYAYPMDQCRLCSACGKFIRPENMNNNRCPARFPVDGGPPEGPPGPP